MSTPVSNFTGKTIYLDTMTAYAFLRGISSEAKDFFKQIEAGAFLAYASVLTFDELAYRLLLALIKDRYGSSPLDRLRGEETRMIAEFSTTVTDLLRRLQVFPNMVILDITAADLDVMNEAMTQYNLRPRDGLHFAAMQRAGCIDLASNDPHFDNVPNVRRFTL